MNITKLIVVALLAVASVSTFARETIVRAQQVNGTWKSRFGEFQVWALGQQRLQVSFNGVYVYTMQNGMPMANVGQADGIAHITGDTARFKPMPDENCELVMRFVGKTLRVTTQGSYMACGFGHNVIADGVYRKTSSKKPKFELNPL